MKFNYAHFFFLLYNHAKIMSNVHTLKDIKNRGHRLGSAYEQELEKKIRSVTEFNSEINDLSEKVVDKEKRSFSEPMLILEIRLAS